MSAAQPCDRTDPHAPHWWRFDTHPSALLVSCPGIDPEQGHTGDRDRPQGQEFDWTPEALHLSDAAAFIVRLHMNEATTARAQYIIGMEVWKQLTAMDEADALTYAYAIATAHPPITAVVPPF